MNDKITDRNCDVLLNSFKELEDRLAELCTRSKADINYFSATSMLTQEIKHSAFLAWLFNPQCEHNLGNAVLQMLIDALPKYKTSDDKQVKSNVEILRNRQIDLSHLAELLNSDKSNISVETERSSSDGKRVDICISIENIDSVNGKYVIVIENKIFTTTHDDQLQNYQRFADEKYPDFDKIFIYLSPRGEIPRDILTGEEYGEYNDAWCIFDYIKIRDIIADLIKSIDNKANFKKLEGKNRRKLKFMFEDYINMVNSNVLLENPNVWERIKEIREKYAEQLKMIYAWEDSSEKALRYCFDWLQNYYKMKIHFTTGGSLKDGECSFRFYTDELKNVFNIDTFGENKTDMPYLLRIGR